MQTAEIKLPSVETVQQFVRTANTIDADIDLGMGTIIIDAKSILGVLALANESHKKFMMTVHSEDKSIMNHLQPFFAC